MKTKLSELMESDCHKSHKCFGLLVVMILHIQKNCQRIILPEVKVRPMADVVVVTRGRGFSHSSRQTMTWVSCLWSPAFADWGGVRDTVIAD